MAQPLFLSPSWNQWTMRRSALRLVWKKPRQLLPLLLLLLLLSPKRKKGQSILLQPLLLRLILSVPCSSDFSQDLWQKNYYCTFCWHRKPDTLIKDQIKQRKRKWNTHDEQLVSEATSWKMRQLRVIGHLAKTKRRCGRRKTSCKECDISTTRNFIRFTDPSSVSNNRFKWRNVAEEIRKSTEKKTAGRVWRIISPHQQTQGHDRWLPVRRSWGEALSQSRSKATQQSCSPRFEQNGSRHSPLPSSATPTSALSAAHPDRQLGTSRATRQLNVLCSSRKEYDSALGSEYFMQICLGRAQQWKLKS